MLKLTKLCGTAGNTDLRIDSDQFTVSDDDYPACSSPEPLFREELAAEELFGEPKLASNKLTDVLHDIQETLREETDPLETESQLIQSDCIDFSLGHF